MVETNFTYAPVINVGGGGGGTAAPAGGGGSAVPPPRKPSPYELAPQYGYSEEDIARAKKFNEELRVRNTMERERVTIQKEQETSMRRQMGMARGISNTILAINMSLLGINFSLMTFGASLKRAGILTDQQYETFIQIQGALGMITSAMQILLSIESLLLALKQLQEIKEWSIAAAKIAQYGMLAIAAVGIVAIALASFGVIGNRARKAAFGAYVESNPVGTPFIVGEGGVNEVIAPEPMLRRIVRESGSGTTVTIYAIDSKGVREALEDLDLDNSRRGY